MPMVYLSGVPTEERNQAQIRRSRHAGSDVADSAPFDLSPSLALDTGFTFTYLNGVMLKQGTDVSYPDSGTVRFAAGVNDSADVEVVSYTFINDLLPEALFGVTDTISSSEATAHDSTAHAISVGGMGLVNHEMVFLNGMLLKGGGNDYTKTSETITIAAAIDLKENDEITVKAFGSVSDMNTAQKNAKATSISDNSTAILFTSEDFGTTTTTVFSVDISVRSTADVNWRKGYFSCRVDTSGTATYIHNVFDGGDIGTGFDYAENSNPAGTTGTDGNMTFCLYNASSKWYAELENRSNATVNVGYQVFAFSG